VEKSELYSSLWSSCDELRGGFLLITFGTGAASVGYFFAHPLSSTHPYRVIHEQVLP
jgi:putative oxidoreductase